MKRIKKYLLLIGFWGCLSGAEAQNLNTPNKKGPLGTQVNTISGNLFIPRTDFAVTARGFNITIRFFYNSYLLNEDVGFGKGWSFNYGIQYKTDSTGSRTIRWGDGREDTYDSVAGGYRPPLGFYSKLIQYQPGKYRLTDTDSTTFFFDNAVHKKITRLQDPNGNFINFIYTDSLLQSLTNADGQSVSFTYNAEGRMATITDAMASPSRTYTYSYDLTGNLVEVKDPLNGKSKYTYLLNGPMKTISDKNDNKVDIIYYPGYATRELVGCNKRLSFSYDSLNKRTVITDHFDNGGANQVTTYTYQKNENLGWITSVSGNCCGYNILYEHDADGNRTKMTDANGQVYKYTYDTNGNLLTITDPLSQVSTYTYSANYNRITSFRDKKGFTYTLTYDTHGNLTQITAPGNNIYTATYNAKGDIISSTDPKGNIFTYNYDAYGNPVNVTGPNGYNATLSFDARGNLLAYTDARGNGSVAEYDILDRLKKITDPINNHLQFTYDANGNMVLAINKNNEISTLNYDASDRPVKMTGPTGNQVFLSYDAMDNITRIKNELGNETKMTYDTRNRLSSTKDPQNNSRGMSYDAHGNITSVSLPNGQTISYSYDALNRIKSVSDATGPIASVTYDKNGNVTSYTNGTGATVSAGYDSLNRLKQVTDALGNSTTYSYDKNSNVTSVTDRNGFTSFFTYDSLNRVKTYTDKNGFVTTIGYDAMGNIVSLKDQNNNTTTYTYDNLNRRKTMTYPNGTFNELTYDNEGKVVSKRLTDGSIINFLYDTLNRIVARQLPGGETYTYSYDALGRVLSAGNSAGTVTLTYDALNRITSETFDGRTVGYQYDISGRTQTTIYPSGDTVKKLYDSRNRLIKLSKNSTVLVEYIYNNANQLTSKTFANGVVSNMQYDFANRLSSISTANGVIQNTSFTYDKEMNKTAVIRHNNPALSEQFSYDNGYRLTNYKRGVIGGSPTIQNTYSYDAVGNRTGANLNGSSLTYSTNNLNQLTGISGAQNYTFTHDGRGNLTFDGIFYKSYDAEGRLLSDSSSPTNVIHYTYDAFNRRVIKNSNGIALKYGYSGLSQIEERDAGNALLNSTVFTGFLSPVVNDKGGSRFYFHQNELNSVEAITKSNGGLAEQYRYDVYGKPSRYDSLNNPLPASIAGNRFGFTGQEYDSASGSYRFFFRNYLPETGVFNQRDLIEYGDGMGMYQYVGNNPANGVDVFGLEEEEEVTIEEIFGRDPCYHDSRKKRLITQSLAKMELSNAIGNAEESKASIDNIPYGIGAINRFFGGGWIQYGRNSDSRFYNGELSPSQMVGGNEFYFKGQTMNSWELNYYFTNSSLAEGGFSHGNSQFVTGVWNDTKAYAVGWNPWWANGAAKRLDEVYLKQDMAEDAFFDRMNGEINNVPALSKEMDFKEVGGFGAFYPVIDPQTGEISREFFLFHKIKRSRVESLRKFIKINCLDDDGGGSRRPNPQYWIDLLGLTEILSAHDPNAIIGPAGQPDVHWVSVKDRMPYTILYENAPVATAPAKYVRITTPIEPKQDAGSFLLGDFGFNSTTFSIPPNTSSYYNRLDVRDSLGLFVDITAGYDPVNNVAFWEFQSIDPITLMPPADPLKGFLLLQDSNSLVNGHGFVTFSIKPKQNSLTLDTIGARAAIVFDENDTIPTNIYTNTIDAFAPTSHMNTISATTNPITLSWSGTDDAGGCGIDYYSIYISTDGVNYTLFIPRISRTDTSFSLPPDSTYCFFVLATDRVGNKETLRPGEIKCTYVGPPLPVTWLYFKGKTVAKDNILDWATANEQNSKQFEVERSLNATDYTRIGIINAAGNSSQTNTYQYTDHRIDRLNSEYMFYRLKQIDIDGRFKYSNVVRLRYNDKGSGNTVVYPNPTPGSITILVGSNALVGTVAALYDINGRLLENIKISSNSQQVDLGKYVNGIYFIRLSNKEVLRIIKQ